jgi:hypothetical protein
MAVGVHAQTVQGVITGTVTDPTGATVANATVTITNADTGIAQTTSTESNGVYRFPLVPPGTYTIELKASGFANERATGIIVQASQTIPMSFKLQVAQTSQVIEVTGQAQLVQTATSDLATQVDNTTIQNMALVDRDVFASLPFLAPQVMPGLDLMPTSGGAREAGTSYMLNGGENNDNFSAGGTNVHPPLESIDNFSIITNNMSAEYGRGAGAVVTATQKTGTNRFHGVLYEFNRNASLNANDYFYNRDLSADKLLPADQRTLSDRPKYIRNQFGGEVDGPIIKDKTFFGFAYDRIKLLAGSTSAHNYVPTSAALAQVKALGEPLAQEVLGARPPVTSDQPCPGIDGTGAGGSVGCLSFFDPITDTLDTYYGRVDHTFSPSDRLSFTANFSRELYEDKFGGGPLTTNGAIPADTINHFHQLGLAETHTFNPALLNEVTISHNRHYNVFQAGKGTADTIPNIYIDAQNEGFLSYEIGGDYEGDLLQNFTQDRWALVDNLTWVKGAHSFKFGGGANYGILYRDWDLGLPGQYEFGELISLQANGQPVTPASDGTLQPDGTIANITDETQANFAGDYPYFQETSIDPTTGSQANAYRHYTTHDYYWFVQDDWKVSPNLTLNLGLRWDRYGAPSEVHGIISQFTNFNDISCVASASCLAGLRVGPVSRMWPTQNHDFAPRIGFAWDPKGDGKMAIRGGYGIAYDRIFDNIWSNGAWNPPFYALIDFEADTGDAVYYSNPASIGAAYNPNGPCGPIPYASNPAAGCNTSKRVSLRGMDQHMHDSSGQNFYFGVERQVAHDFLFRVNYQGALGRHLPMLENYNRVDGIGANSTLSPVLPNPLYNGFNYRSNSVTSNYNALVVEAQKRMSNGLQFQTSYTYSKLLDENSELFAGCSTIGASNANYYYTSNLRPQMEYGTSSYDHRGSYKFNVIYEIPFLKEQKGFVGHALGGWHVGSFFQLYSGHPLNVWDGRTRYRARDANGNVVNDASGVPINLGGDYNLDGTANERPVFVGKHSDLYGHHNPANGIFKDNNPIGCGASWVPGNVANVDACNTRFGVTTPNAFFETPAYPSSGAGYERYNGLMARDVFTGPQFIQLDMSLGKTFKIFESQSLDFRAQAQNLANHPNFDCVTGNLSSGTFGQATCLTPFGLGEPKSRVMSLGLRYAF